MPYKGVLFAAYSPNVQPMYLILSSSTEFCCKHSFAEWLLTTLEAGEMFKKKMFWLPRNQTACEQHSAALRKQRRSNAADYVGGFDFLPVPGQQFLSEVRQGAVGSSRGEQRNIWRYFWRTDGVKTAGWGWGITSLPFRSVLSICSSTAY